MSHLSNQLKPFTLKTDTGMITRHTWNNEWFLMMCFKSGTAVIWRLCGTNWHIWVNSWSPYTKRYVSLADLKLLTSEHCWIRITEVSTVVKANWELNLLEEIKGIVGHLALNVWSLPQHHFRALILYKLLGKQRQWQLAEQVYIHYLKYWDPNVCDLLFTNLFKLICFWVLSPWCLLQIKINYCAIFNER